MVTVLDGTNELALHTPDGISEERQTEFAFLERCRFEATTKSLLRLEKDSRQILLICPQHLEGEFAGDLDYGVTAAVRPNTHHYQWRFERSLGHPACRETVYLIAVAYAADKEPVGDLAKQDLLGVGVEAHGTDALAEI